MSSIGVRVEFLDPSISAEPTRILNTASSQLLDVVLVWRSETLAAFTITGSRHLRGYAEGDLEAIKAWWIAHRSHGSE